MRIYADNANGQGPVQPGASARKQDLGPERLAGPLVTHTTQAAAVPPTGAASPPADRDPRRNQSPASRGHRERDPSPSRWNESLRPHAPLARTCSALNVSAPSSMLQSRRVRESVTSPHARDPTGAGRPPERCRSAGRWLSLWTQTPTEPVSHRGTSATSDQVPALHARSGSPAPSPVKPR